MIDARRLFFRHSRQETLWLLFAMISRAFVDLLSVTFLILMMLLVFVTDCDPHCYLTRARLPETISILEAARISF